MPEPAPNAELMRSLGRLVRGLSALFWGLPTSLVFCFHTAKAETLQTFGVLPPLICTGVLVFGLWQLAAFQKQERVWQATLDRARILSLINLFLSPFLLWSNRIPGNSFFAGMVLLMMFSGLLFLASLNSVLQRLGAMLPDEALRQETRQFTTLNLNLVLLTFLIAIAYYLLGHFRMLPTHFPAILFLLEHGFWLPMFLVLLPLAMTMALLWKTKEVILDNVFSAKQPSA
jgi:hypothetical protein